MKIRLIILVIWTLILLVLLLVPMSQNKIFPIWTYRYAGDICHFILFFITAVISLFSTKYFWSFRLRVIICSVFGIFLAVASEAVQLLIPERYMTADDLIVNTAGLGAGIILCILLRRNRKTRFLFDNAD